jgi:hypothetical protein
MLRPIEIQSDPISASIHVERSMREPLARMLERGESLIGVMCGVFRNRALHDNPLCAAKGRGPRGRFTLNPADVCWTSRR